MNQVWKTEGHWRIMEVIHSAPGQTLLLSSLLQHVPFADVQSLARLNVIRYERDQQRRGELIVTFRSKLTYQVFDEIQQSVYDHRDCRETRLEQTRLISRSRTAGKRYFMSTRSSIRSVEDEVDEMPELWLLRCVGNRVTELLAAPPGEYAYSDDPL